MHEAHFLYVITKLLIMKNLLLTGLLLTCIAATLNAQQKHRVKTKDVPPAVQGTFKTEYPDARDAEWILKDGTYKVEFEVRNVDNIAAFDATGKLLSKGIEIKKSELPAAVSSALKARGKAVDDVYKVEKDGNIHYLIELKGNPDGKVMYSAEGQVIEGN